MLLQLCAAGRRRNAWSRSWLHYALPSRHVSLSTQTEINAKILHVLGLAVATRHYRHPVIYVHTRAVVGCPSESRPEQSATYRSCCLLVFAKKKKKVRRRNGSDNASERRSHPAAVAQSSRKSAAMLTDAALPGVCQSEMRCPREVNFKEPDDVYSSLCNGTTSSFSFSLSYYWRPILDGSRHTRI